VGKGQMLKEIIEDENLEKIRRIIISEVAPDRIILFGSRTKKNVSGAGDYDILVLKRNIGNERNLSRKIHHALFREKIQTPVDVLALDMDRWEEKKNEKGLIFHEIEESGILIYE